MQINANGFLILTTIYPPYLLHTYFILRISSIQHTTHPLLVILHPLTIAPPLCRLLQPDCQPSAVRCPAYPLGQKWPSKPLIRIPETICRRVIASDGELVLSSWMPCSPFSGISGSLCMSLVSAFPSATPPPFPQNTSPAWLSLFSFLLSCCVS